MWRRTIPAAIAAAALVLGAGPRPASSQSRELPAQIVTIGGHAEVTRPGAPGWVPVSLGEHVGEAQGARTRGGRLTLKTVSGQSLRLGPSSQVFLSGEDGAGPVRVRMDGGRLWVAVRPNAAPASQVELRAGPVNARVLTGGAGITMNPDGSVRVAVYHGAVTCAGEGWQRGLAEGQELLVPAAAPPPKEPAKLKRDKREGEWIKWNEQQDLAGGYGGPRPE